MKYYSEKTKKVYDTVKDLQTAETEFDKAHAAEIAKQKERKARADEIKAARQAVIDAQKRYNALLDSFIKDYGSYHETYTSNDIDSHLDHIFSRMFGI